jgi:hypothetical protein
MPSASIPFDDIDLAIFERLLDGQSNEEALETLRSEYPPKSFPTSRNGSQR